MNNNCPFCGCDPTKEPYAMEPTHCPQCGYDFYVSEQRKQDLLNEMHEYIAEYIGDEEEMPIDIYDGAWYIKELVGASDICDALRNRIGMTDEEIMEIGF